MDRQIGKNLLIIFGAYARIGQNRLIPNPGRSRQMGFRVGVVIAATKNYVDVLPGFNGRNAVSVQADPMKRLGMTRIHHLILLLSVLVGVALAVVLLETTRKDFFSRMEHLGKERLELYASTVQAAHRRFDYLPFVVANDEQVKQLIEGGTNAQTVNVRLGSWQQESGAAELFLLDGEGLVIAASNWDRADTFIGNNYGFRPYFKQAMSGQPGRFFGVGVTTGRPGLFLSRPVTVGETVKGVAVVKIDLTQLEKDWTAGGESVWVADPDRVVFLASDPAWKYKSIGHLDDSVLRRLHGTKKYSTNRVEPLPMRSLPVSSNGPRIIELKASGSRDQQQSRGGDQHFLLHSRLIEELDWTLYFLTNIQPLRAQERNVIFIAVLITMLVALLGFYVVGRVRHRQLLEQQVEQRTRALNETNDHLVEEVAERRRTEEELRKSKEGLVQAEKLAALGQMSAGLVHEINQPLSAMQTFIASTRVLIERDKPKEAISNLEDLDAMTRRMSNIVSHLKTFASKSKSLTQLVVVERVIDNALIVMGPRLSESQIELIWCPGNVESPVQADEIKLEQIIVNLIRNALDAIQHSDTKSEGRLEVSVKRDQQITSVMIKDNGCGINADDLPKVFDPFFTTKDPGKGLGLGLSVSYGIAKEFGGDLEVGCPAEGGTVFKLSLASAESQEVKA